jgi:hypothetical protein
VDGGLATIMSNSVGRLTECWKLMVGGAQLIDVGVDSKLGMSMIGDRYWW